MCNDELTGSYHLNLRYDLTVGFTTLLRCLQRQQAALKNKNTHSREDTVCNKPVKGVQHVAAKMTDVSLRR